jgi:intracellular septation protein A
MIVFLILAPFAAFAGLTMVTSATASLFGAAGVALATIAWDISRGGSLKILASGAVILFGALGGYLTLVDSSWSTPSVRLAVDIGVLVIALASIVARYPFTLQYAREVVDAETAKLPGFMRVNYIITWAWTAAFVLMVIANLLTIYLPSLPFWAGIAIALAARNSAALFTKWYPKHRMAKLAKAALPAAAPMANA